MVEEAAKNDAKLIVLVEMATTAYCFFDRAEIAPYVEPIPGPTTERFGELAARYGCYIVVGMPEVDHETDIYYNSLALVGPDGVVGKYRKPTHSSPKTPGPRTATWIYPYFERSSEIWVASFAWMHPSPKRRAFSPSAAPT